MFKKDDIVVYQGRPEQPSHLQRTWFGRIFRVLRVRTNGLSLQAINSHEIVEIDGFDKFALVDDYDS